MTMVHELLWDQPKGIFQKIYSLDKHWRKSVESNEDFSEDWNICIINCVIKTSFI
jgi:hypothetical protein